MITGLTPSTYQKLQLNAGMLLRGWTIPDDITTASALKAKLHELIEAETNTLGATRGGGTFTCTPSMRGIEADGKRSEFVGSMVNDGWTVKLTATLLEITGKNFAAAFPGADVETTGSVTTIKPRTQIEDEDYASLVWVGDTSQGAMAIELENALNLTGANFTFTDKGEGTLPVEFQAFQSDVLEQGYAPCKLYFFDDAE